MHRDWLNQEIQRVSGWRHHYWLAPPFAVGIEPQSDVLDQAISNSEAVFKHDLTTTVVRLSLGQDDFVLKRYNPRSYWHKLKRAFRRSRARRCWDMSYRFQSIGLNVAQPILMYEQRIGPICRDTYFINRYLQGQELLSLLPITNHRQQVEIADAVRQAFASMRAHRLSHGDMKASNLLWVDGELYFIDLDASRKHLTSIGWRASSYKDKKRFLKNWQDQPDLLQLFSDI